MEDDNKVEIEIGKDRKSYAGIPEADFVVSDLLIFSLRVCARACICNREISYCF